MGKALEDPERPFVAILGGAKVSDKIGVITNLLDKCDSLIIGGGMAYTFFKAQGLRNRYLAAGWDSVGLAKELMAKAKTMGKNLLLPVDNVVATAYAPDAENKIIDSDNIPEGWMGLDIGPKTRELFRKTIVEAKTVIWNGPMGVFEMPAFAEGTRAVAAACANARARCIDVEIFAIKGPICKISKPFST